MDKRDSGGRLGRISTCSLHVAVEKLILIHPEFNPSSRLQDCALVRFANLDHSCFVYWSRGQGDFLLRCLIGQKKRAELF